MDPWTEAGFDQPKKAVYYLLDLERSATNKVLVWWKANDNGYTTNLKEAGKYGGETIMKRKWRYSDKDTRILPCEEIDKLAVTVVFKDFGDLINEIALKL
jgi:hypothetical protein